MIYQNYIRVLYVDMENETSRIEDRQDLKCYIGGVGTGAKLLEENMRPELHPLAPEQPIVLANGALSTIFPVMTKTVAMFISPLTGELGESHAGARWAMGMTQAGYDAIVITGKAKRPTYLTINDKGVIFHDARALWGTGVDTRLAIRKQWPELAGRSSILHIGEAGENAWGQGPSDGVRHGIGSLAK